MRVLIFSMPRCGTSILSTCIQSRAGIKNLSEAFGDPANGFRPAYGTYDPSKNASNWLASQPNFIIKLLSTNLWFISFRDLIKKVNFSDIIVIKRSNLTDCCVSLMLAEQTGKYHHSTPPRSIDPFICYENDVKRWCNQYVSFCNEVTWLNNNASYKLVDYDSMIQGAPVEVSGHKVLATTEQTTPKLSYANIDYRRVCSNYEQVEEWIKQWTN